MPTIAGDLRLVTDMPADSIGEAWVRARETRGLGTGLIVGVNDQIPVDDGHVSFTAVPGAAILVLVQQGMPVETLPMLISDEPEQSLRLVVQAAQAAGAAELGVLEQLAADVASDVARAEQYRTEAVAAAGAAKASENAAADSATTAGASEAAAKTSETNAKTSETNAQGSATAAEESRTKASNHEIRSESNRRDSESFKNMAEAAATRSESAAQSAKSDAESVEGVLDAASAYTQAARDFRDDAAQSESSSAGYAGVAGQAADAAVEAADAVGAAELRVQASETAASASETNAKRSENDARGSAEAASSSEANAKSSEIAAKTSETNAKSHAESAAESAQLADPEGLRDEITNQIVELVDGAPEDLNTLREIATYAQENRDITDQLNAAIGGKANKTHSHKASDVQWEQVPLNEILTTVTSRLSNLRAWFRGDGPPPSEIPGAQIGDWYLDESSMELHEITGV